MKKIIALMLAFVMCISMAACGNDSGESDTDDTNLPAVENTENGDEEVAGEGADGSEGYEPVFKLTAEQADEYYRAVMNGEVSGTVADIIKSMEEYDAKMTLDAISVILGTEDFLGKIGNLDAGETDMVMTEANFIIDSYFGDEEDDVSDVSDEEFTDEFGTVMTLFEPDLERTLIVELNPDHAFLEPDWTMIKDQPSNWFINIDNNYETYTLRYGAMDRSTEELIDMFIHNKAARDGIEATTTEVETFTAGGMEWELFAIVYEKTSTGIDKETNKEVTTVYTAYEPICFARPDSDTALQIDAGVSHSEDILNYYRELIQTSISDIKVK